MKSSIKADKIMELSRVSKCYIKDNKEIEILTDVNVNFKSGCFYAIMGHSGSGKTSLINILGLVDNNYLGNYILYDKNPQKFNDNELAKLRLQNIGFIFQNYLLNPNLKAYENVIVPMLINENISSEDRIEKANKLLKDVGLEERAEHFPNELSGGEQQRVAIARALANDPSIILADEPSGNLDEKSEKEIFDLLKKLSKNGKCIIVVSHSNEVKNYADELLTITNGRLVGGNK